MVSIRFDQVLSDNRCPSISVCSAPGSATVRISVMEDGEVMSTHDITVPGAIETSPSDEDGGADATAQDPTAPTGITRIGNDRVIHISALEPYPVSIGAAAGDSDANYTVIMKVAEVPSVDIEPMIIARNTMTYGFMVTLDGGDSFESVLYCSPVAWTFGDDSTPVVLTPTCPPWTPDSEIQRAFEMVHTFPSPGEYEVTFSHGRLAPSTFTFLVEEPDPVPETNGESTETATSTDSGVENAGE